MLHGRSGEKLNVIPAATLALYDDLDIPKDRLRNEPVEASVAKRLIKNELLDEGNARLNLATFCSTYMEEDAVTLMFETLEKNAIDKSEYPSTIELENRCVNIIANLWGAPEKGFIGTSTVGSSEASMLAGLAMKFRWRNRAQALGMDITKQKPNLIISSGYQVCWKKFCIYWDVELREVPISLNQLNLDVEQAIQLMDEYTIGIVGILGQTYTGVYDDMKQLNDALEGYNQKTEHKVYIHVDAASGGLFVPFAQPELAWDFRLQNVISINASGHKYGLVYPGIGWIVWRNENDLPKELIFEVGYLGGKMPTMSINFSRSASQIVAQYYNFLRFGFNGFLKIHQYTQHVAAYLTQEFIRIGLFDIVNQDYNSIPVVCFKFKDMDVSWNLYDLSNFLERSGWKIPVYHLPNQLEDVTVSRIVCRSDLSLNLAEHLMEDILFAIRELTESSFSYPNKREAKGFKH